jgi:hypothetical protein
MQESVLLSGVSFESLEDAASNAMGPQSDNDEQFGIVSMSVERGGIVGRTQYSVLMRRLPVSPAA